MWFQLRFMRRFGYLDQNPDDSEALYHETAIVEAIKNVQKFGALNQTGKLDQTTLDVSICLGYEMIWIMNMCLYMCTISSQWKEMSYDKDEIEVIHSFNYLVVQKAALWCARHWRPIVLFTTK